MSEVPFPDPTISGVILAGGESRRMGRDKATLLLDGQTLVARIAAVLRQVCATVLIAGARPDLQQADLPVVSDLYPGSALGGLHGALSAATTPWILAVACDLPLVTPELLRAIIARRTAGEIVVPVTARGVEPLCALYSKRCLPVMERRLLARTYAVHALFDEVATCYLDVAKSVAGGESSLHNFNTPADLAAYHAGLVQDLDDSGESDA